MMLSQCLNKKACNDNACNWRRLAGFQNYPSVAVGDRVFWMCDQARCAVPSLDLNNNVIGAQNLEYTEAPTRPVTPDVEAPSVMIANGGRKDDEDDGNGPGDNPNRATASLGDLVKQYMFIIKWIFCFIAVLLILQGLGFCSNEKVKMKQKEGDDEVA